MVPRTRSMRRKIRRYSPSRHYHSSLSRRCSYLNTEGPAHTHTHTQRLCNRHLVCLRSSLSCRTGHLGFAFRIPRLVRSHPLSQSSRPGRLRRGGGHLKWAAAVTERHACSRWSKVRKPHSARSWLGRGRQLPSCRHSSGCHSRSSRRSWLSRTLPGSGSACSLPGKSAARVGTAGRWECDGRKHGWGAGRKGGTGGARGVARTVCGARHILERRRDAGGALGALGLAIRRGIRSGGRHSILVSGVIALAHVASPA